MRISTITNWAYGLTLVLTGLSGAAFLASAHAIQEERAAVEQDLAFDTLAENLAAGTDLLTSEARLYAVRGAERHRDAYRYEANVVRTRDRALDQVRGMGAAPGELAAVAEAERGLKELNQIESGAVADIEAGQKDAAQALLFGPEHERAQSTVVAALDHFRALANARTEAEKVRTLKISILASDIAKTMLGLTALLFLGVLYFVLRRRVSLPLTQMTGVVTRLAHQDFAVEAPLYRRRDEIGDMSQAIEIFRQNGLERERLEAERRADQAAKDSILQMMHRLQACETRAELAEVVACFAPQTFPDLAGRLYVFDDSHNALNQLTAWQEPAHSAEHFAPTACWGLRRGRPHHSNGEHNDVACPHIADPHVRSLCVPLTAQGETIGLLYFEERAQADAHRDVQRVYLELMSDNVALALANLRLRERLANLAVRDGMTGLYNRRSLDEALKRHAAEASELACIMVDIDHFKRFNDDFGHDAGDAVMQHVAQVMLEVVGGAGDAYRFGGEEFTILLPALDSPTAFALAEAVRAQIAATPLAHHGKMLGHITVSLGLAVAPVDGPVATILRCADAALLDAKSSGRNRTVMAGAMARPVDAAPLAPRRARTRSIGQIK